MKKKILFLIMIVIILVAGIFAWYLTPKTFAKGIHPEDVAYISVFDGRTGIGFQVDDPAYVKEIVENLQSTELKRDGIVFDSYPMYFRFFVEGIDKRGKTILPVVFLTGNQNIYKKPFTYVCDGDLCIDLLEELEAEWNTSYATSEVFVDSENNQLWFESDGAIVVGGIPYYATGNSYGDAICGNDIKYVEFELPDEGKITAWSPVYENTMCVLLDGEWKEYSMMHIMTGTILEITDGSMLVKPIENSWELSSSDKFMVPLEHIDSLLEPMVGDVVEITYDGSIEETYPARLGKIQNIDVYKPDFGDERNDELPDGEVDKK